MAVAVLVGGCSAAGSSRGSTITQEAGTRAADFNILGRLL